jgi:curli biogenesis system outer membrane secretion channel CsgG
MTLQPLIEKLTQLDAFPEHILVSLRTIQGFGNLGSHHQPGEPAEITPEFAQPCLAALGTVVQWYFKEYGSGVAAGPIITTRPTRSGQNNRSGNAAPRIAIIAATAAVTALLLAGVVAWNTRNQPQPKSPSVTPSPETAATPSQPTVADAQETTKPPSPTGRDKTAAPSTIPNVTDFVRPSGASTPRIAVLPFEQFAAPEQDPQGLKKGIATVVAARLEQSGMFDLVERARLDAVLAELDLSQSDKFDVTQAVKIGKLLGAKQLVLGSIFTLGDKLRLDARVVDTETADVIYAVDREGSPDKVDATP